jgi:hypothetical protein
MILQQTYEQATHLHFLLLEAADRTTDPAISAELQILIRHSSQRMRTIDIIRTALKNYSNMVLPDMDGSSDIAWLFESEIHHTERKLSVLNNTQKQP